ncbi:MAG: hypothetical protein ACLFO2_01280 [Candidatus Woesearchaeota archaeon]
MAEEHTEDEDQFESVYNEGGREELTDNDEISPEEEAFMAGYDEEQTKEEGEKRGDQAYEEAFDSKKDKKKK